MLATGLSGNARFVVTRDYKLARLKEHRRIFLAVHQVPAMVPALTDESRSATTASD